MTSERRKRVVKGLFANGYGQLITLAVQLSSIPLFLSVWTLEEYGSWILISTVPTYLALSDFGLLSAAGSRMTVLVGRGAVVGAAKLFRSLLKMVAYLVLVLLLIAALLGLILQASGVAPGLSWAASVLIVGAAVGQVGGLATGVFRATYRNHLGSTFTANARLAEWCFGMVFLLASGTAVGVAVGMVLGRTGVTLLSIRAARRGWNQFEWRPSGARPKLALLLLGQSGATFSISIANAVVLQGFTLLAGAVYGVSQVAVFNTYRTVARSAVQVTATLSHAAWPEFSLLFGERKLNRLGTFYRRTARSSLFATLAVAIAVVTFLPIFLGAWTRNEVPYDLQLSTVFALYALAAGSWHVPRVFLTAIGKNTAIARIVMAASTIGLAAAALALVVDIPIEWIVICMILVEVVSSIAARMIAAKALLPRLDPGDSPTGSAQ